MSTEISSAGGNPGRREHPSRLSVTAAIILESGKVLIASRGKSDVWEFPGGKVEAEEKLEDCVVREIMEELDMAVEVVRPFLVTHYDDEESGITLHSFICKIISGRPNPLAGQKTAWVNVDELAGYNLLPADRLLIEPLKKMNNKF